MKETGNIDPEIWSAPATKGDVARLALTVRAAVLHSMITIKHIKSIHNKEALVANLISELDKTTDKLEELFVEFSGWQDD